MPVRRFTLELEVSSAQDELIDVVNDGDLEGQSYWNSLAEVLNSLLGANVPVVYIEVR